ncbi:GTP cyclohydrolase I [Paraburkholderia sp. 32]|uniref:GTP cyclohydrolase I n=2 Tax=Paraburkholderia TaxID=1822464 RepID=UPI003D1A0F34
MRKWPRRLDEFHTVGSLPIRPMRSHHLASVTGRAWIGVIPGDRLIGVSQFNRLADWVMSCSQIQKEAVMQLADENRGTGHAAGLGRAHPCNAIAHDDARRV